MSKQIQIENLKNIDIRSELIEKLNSTDNFNENIWKLTKLLIYNNLKTYFTETEGVTIIKNMNIYKPNLFGKNIDETSSEISEKLDLNFPKPEKSLKRFLILVSINLLWIVFVILSFITFPDIYMTSIQLIMYLGLLIFFLPVIILLLLFKKFFAFKKFRGIATFDDLVEKLFIMNLYKYKINNYTRLKIELDHYLHRGQQDLER